MFSKLQDYSNLISRVASLVPGNEVEDIRLKTLFILAVNRRCHPPYFVIEPFFDASNNQPDVCTSVPTLDEITTNTK